MTRRSADRFRLDLNWQGDDALVAVRGLMDVRGVTELSERLSEIIKVARPRKLIVDLANVAYADQAAAAVADADRPRRTRRLKNGR